MGNELALKIKINADGSAAVTELRRVDGAVTRTGDSAGAAARDVQDLSSGMTKLTAVAAGVAGTLAAASRAVAQAGDNARLAQVQMSRLLGDGGYGAAMDLANDLGASVASAVESVNFFAPTMQKLGKATGDTIGFISDLNKSLQLYGAKGAQAASVTTQLAQAFSSGQLAGDELKSLGENAAGLYVELERAVQTIVGSDEPLKQLGADGKVTSEVLYQAFSVVFAKIRGEFDSLPETLEKNEARMGNAWDRMLAALDEKTQASAWWQRMERGLADIMNAVADQVTGQISGGAAPEAGQFSGEVAKLSQEMAQLQTRAAALRKDMGSMFNAAPQDQERIKQELADIDAALARLNREQQQYIALAAQDREVTQGAAEASRAKAKATDAQTAALGKLKGLNSEFSGGLQAMIQAASAEGVVLGITSGLRSSEEQAKLWADALVKYGSAEIARKWVAPPGSSMHEKGMAADIKADAEGYKWLAENVERFGLALPLSNERWHVELAGARAGKEAAKAMADAKRAEAAAHKEAQDAILDNAKAQYSAADAYASALAPMEQLIASLKDQAAQAGMTAAEQARADAQTRISGMIQEATANQAAAAQRAVEEAMRSGRAVNMAIADSYGEAAAKLREMTPEALALAEAAVVAKDKSQANLPTVQELWTKTVENIAEGIQSTIADAFEALFSGAVKSAKDGLRALKTVVVRALAELAAGIASQKIVVPILASVGLASAGGASGSGSGGSGSSSSLGSLSGISNLFGGTSLGTGLSTTALTALGNLGISIPESIGKGFSLLANTPNWMLGGAGIAGGFLGSLLFDGGYSDLGSSIGSTAGSVIGSMLLPGIGTAIGAALGGMGGGWLGSLFGAGSTKPPMAYIAINGGDFSSGTNQGMRGQAPEIEAAVKKVNDTLDAFAATLGEGAKNALAGFTQAMQPMTGDQIQGWLTERTQAAIGAMVNSTAGLVGEMAREAWNASGGDIAAFERSMQQIQAVMAVLPDIAAGLQDAGMNLGADAERSTLALIKMAGGLEAFAQSQANYDKLFLSPSEQADKQFEGLKSTMEDIGWATIPARDELKAWVDALDLSDESARASRLAILANADALDRYYSTIEDFVASLKPESTGADSLLTMMDWFHGLGIEMPQTSAALYELIQAGGLTADQILWLAARSDDLAKAFAELAKSEGDAIDANGAFIDSLKPDTDGQEALKRMRDAFASVGLEMPRTSAALYDLIQAGKLTDEQIRWLIDHTEELGAAFEELARIQQNLADIYDVFASEAAKLADAQKMVDDAFASIGMNAPKTRAELEALWASLTEEQRNALGSIDGLAAALDAVFGAAEDAATAAQQAAEEAARAAIDAERQAAQDAHEARMEELDAERQAAQEALSEIEAIVSSLESAIDSLKIESDALAQAQFEAAQKQLTLWAAIPGYVPTQDQLDEALKGLSGLDPSNYATQQEYAAAYWQTMSALQTLDRRAETQKTIEEQTLDMLDQQIELENQWYEDEMARLDAMVEALDAAFAAPQSPVHSIGEPIGGASAGPYQTLDSTTLAAGGGTQTDTLLQELIDLLTAQRTEERMETAQLATYQKTSADMLRKWDEDGLPDFRDGGSAILKVA